MKERKVLVTWEAIYDIVDIVESIELNRLSRYKKQQKEKLYMMMIHRNLLLQWKRHFDWL